MYTTYAYQLDGAWFAECAQLPGCVSDGTTSGQALANLQDAIREYVQSLIDDGLPVPAMPTYSAVSWSA